MTSTEDMDLLFGPEDEAIYERAPELLTQLQVNASMRRRDYHLTRLDEIEEVFAAEYKRLDARHEEICGPIKQKIGWHTVAIEAFHRAALAAKRAKPTLAMPSGQSLLRAKKPVVEIVDEEELLLWAEDNNFDLLPDVKRTVMKSKLNAILDIKEDETLEPGALVPFASVDGTPVPGVRVVAQQRTFSIKENK